MHLVCKGKITSHGKDPRISDCFIRARHDDKVSYLLLTSQTLIFILTVVSKKRI